MKKVTPTPLIRPMVPLVIGFGIYFFFRGVPSVGIASVFKNVSSSNTAIRSFIYSAPDGLWLYSLLQCLLLIWSTTLFRKGWFWYTLAITIAFASEIAQRFHLISGTYDKNDLLAYTVAVVLFFGPVFYKYFSHKPITL